MMDLQLALREGFRTVIIIDHTITAYFKSVPSMHIYAIVNKILLSSTGV